MIKLNEIEKIKIITINNSQLSIFKFVMNSFGSLKTIEASGKMIPMVKESKNPLNIVKKIKK